MGVVTIVYALLCCFLTAQAQVQYKADDGTGIAIFYKTSWSSPRIHYSSNGGRWTAVPGVVMTASNDFTAFPPAQGWFRFNVAGSSLEFVFNNGNGVWDNNNNANYKVARAGTYSVGGTAAVPAPTTPPPPPGAPAPVIVPPDLPNCETFRDTCSGLSHPASDEAKRWQTPARNSSEWTPADQDYRSLQGYAHVVYAADRRSATVAIRTVLRVDPATVSCTYRFNGVPQSSPTFTATSQLSVALDVLVTCQPRNLIEQWTLQLDPINFVWQNAPVNQPAQMRGGQRGAIVDLFGWPYADIEAECADFLGKAGYLGVKINPPQEAVMSDVNLKDGGQRNPWYFVYQPVSYRLYSRLGSRAALRSMIQTCRANGVRVYIDAVVNHMSASGTDRHPTQRRSSCVAGKPHSSTFGSPYYTRKYQYQYNRQTGKEPTLEFPAVPFGPSDFHCEMGISSYKDPYQVANGWLVSLSDLDTGKTSVRERIAQYFVDLMGIGVSGMRIDAIKHIHPADVAAIFGLFTRYMGGSLPSDFVSWGELLLGGEAQMLACDENDDFNFFRGLDRRYRAEGISETDIAKLKIWSSEYPNYHPTCGYWVLPASRFVIQNDDHDQQAPGSSSREMGDKGSVLIREKNVGKHRQFQTQLFTRTDGAWDIKVVLSSYTFTNEGATGFPDGYSACGGNTGVTCSKSMPYEKAFRAGSCGYTVENFAGGKYTRVHRDLPIVNAMRAWMGLPSVTARDVGITGSC